MDNNTVFGTVLGIILIAVGIKMGGSLSAFINIPSVFVVFGGGLSAMAVAYSYDRTMAALRMIKFCYMAPKEYNYMKLVSSILLTADVARKEGILALDSRIAEIDEPFLARGLQMVVDGVDVKIIEDILDTELDSRANRHADVKAALDFLSSVIPAFGMIGTIMGLVGLLGNLDDPTSIGPNMAVALITTFYGAVAANLLFIPFGKKAEERSNAEQMYGEIIARGCMFIAAGVHPRIIQERLLAFMSDQSRLQFNELHLSEELGEGG
ncbi:MAG: motility protein A [Candidatus Riflebacteria bacterium HGW-Riflebacteria-1]|nr:MAG: motility protein A [Candidatus Riflebacteria bacterium HGW-Riflebacteria-1]